MCVRIVFVLVLCCVQSWAQRDPTSSHGFQDRDENPRMYSQVRPLPLDQFPLLTDVTEHPYMLATPGYEAWPRPMIVQSPRLPNIPEDTGMPPEERLPFGQSSDNPGMQEHPQGRPSLYSLIGPPPGTEHPLDPMDWENADKRQAENADPPSNLTVVALPLQNSDHELQLNVSWVPSSGVPANRYSLYVKSVTETSNCASHCYKPSIPNNVTSVLVPETWNTVHGTPCAIRPGCAYLVTLQTDPWDGKNTVNLTKQLGECEAGVCSCAHSHYLPVPVVSVETFTFNNTLYSNVSWTLPTPSHPQRLPPKLRKQNYIVSLYKQLSATPAIKTPIFIRLQIPVQVNTNGLIFEGDTLYWQLLPIPLELPLLAKVQLVDERGCVGPAGNATFFASVPVEDAKLPSKSKLSFGIYEILGVAIGAFAMGAVFVLVLKRVLKACRPARVSAPLQPLIRRPVPFSNNYEYEK